MKEKTKLLILIGVLIVFISSIVIIVTTNKGKDTTVKEKFDTLYNSRKYEVLYIAQTTCDYCKNFEVELEEVAEEFDVDYLKINIDQVLTTTANYIVEKLGVSELKTPYIAIIKEGAVVQSGNFMLADEILEIFKTYGLVSQDADLGITYIDLDQYNQLINSSQISIIGFSSAANYASQTKTVKSVWKEIVNENNIAINYFDLLFSSDEEYETFTKSLEIFNDETFELPILAIIKNNKVIGYVSNTTSKQDFVNLLKENNLIK